METLYGIPITDDIRQVLRLADTHRPDMTPAERAEWEREFAKLKTHSFAEVMAHFGLTEADLETVVLR